MSLIHDHTCILPCLVTLGQTLRKVEAGNYVVGGPGRQGAQGRDEGMSPLSKNAGLGVWIGLRLEGVSERLRGRQGHTCRELLWGSAAPTH